MAKTTMFLTKMIPETPPLENLVAKLPSPAHPLPRRLPRTLVVPENIVCFQRHAASGLNRPRRGRALHHRCVLMMALKTAATVCVDESFIRLEAGEGLMVFPFQFHHYLNPESEDVLWLFVTFDLSETAQLEPLRFKPFQLTSDVRVATTEFLSAYAQEGGESDLPALLLALLLARLRRIEGKPRRNRTASDSQSMVTQVNKLAQKSALRPGVSEISQNLGISSSHLRARFRASCGVSIGRHLRRIRLEKACGLLRLTSNRVSEIAEECGFNSIYHFSRAFRTAYGISPLEYRRTDRTPPPRVRLRKRK
jgi:AraC-like DNA-binding protein